MDIHALNIYRERERANKTWLMLRNFIVNFRLGMNEENHNDLAKGASVKQQE
jgi:hypothetical protein